MSNNNKFFFLLYLLILGVAGLVAAEFYIRIFSPEGYITPDILRERSFQTVPAVFARSVLPQMPQTIKMGDKVVAHINARGYRGKEFEVPKPPGIVRIIIYGGSAVFDINATGDNDWPQLTEDILRQRGLTNVEVINAGILAHAAPDSLGRLFAEGHLFDPDYVILYNSWNDMKYFSDDRPILRSFIPKTGHRLYYYQTTLDKFICELSQLYVRLRYRYIMWQDHMGLEGQMPLEHSDHIAQSALRQYKLTLETFVDIAKNINATPILTLQARLLNPTNTAAEKALISFHSQTLTPAALLKATLLIEQITRDVSQRKEIPLMDASTPLSGNTLYLDDHVHTTPEGSRALAEITANILEPLIRTATKP